MTSGSTASAVRKSLKSLEEGLALFTTQLAQETAELRRNVDNQPTTGATFYARILEDLTSRLEGVGQELQALEGVSLDAISLEELVGHSVALYRQNHQHIQQLEARLAQYGYRDLYAPLPPENPLDMLELAAAPPSAAGGAGYAGAGEDADGHAAAAYGEHPDGEEAGEGAAPEALAEVTNRLAGAHLGPACDMSPPPAQQQQQQQQQLWGLAGTAAGGGAAPRTTLKAMAPLTAAKALLLRADDTPSSIASPEAMSPSMRELLGKYAASSSSGGTQQQRLSAAPPSAAATPPRPGSAARATPPVPSYLSPAFQLAAMEQEVQMAHAGAAAQGGTPAADGAGAAWQADDAMYSALTATAAKLAGKPSFLEAYRHRFPAIMASTERLLATVEKQRRPAAAAAVAQEEAAGGPVAALAMAAQQAGGAPQQQQPQPPQPQQEDRVREWQGEASWRQAEEESTLDLMGQILGRGAQAAAAQEQTEDISGAAAAAGSTRFHQRAAAGEQRGTSPPSTAAPLSRAAGGGGGGVARGAAAPAAFKHPISSLREDAAQVQAAAAAAQSAPRSERSKPGLEEAIAAALRRGTTGAPTPAGPAAPSGSTAPPPPAAPTPAALAAPAAAAQPPTAARAQPLAPLSVARPPAPPSAAPAAPPPAAAPAPVTVPALRLVAGDEYGALPTFIKSQLPLEALNSTLAAVHAAARERGGGFTMEDVQAAGLGAKCKVVVNSLVKLGRAQLKVLPNHGGTVYLLA